MPPGKTIGNISCDEGPWQGTYASLRANQHGLAVVELLGSHWNAIGRGPCDIPLLASRRVQGEPLHGA